MKLEHFIVSLELSTYSDHLLAFDFG